MSKRKKHDILQRLAMDLEQRVRPFTRKQLLRALRVREGADRQKVLDAIENMISQNRIQPLGQDVLRVRHKGVEMEGRLDMSSNGFGFVVSEQSDVDIFIPPSALNTAQHGDTVRVMVHKTKRRPEGEIIEIAQRARTDFVGVLHIRNNVGYVIPDGRRLQQNISIAAEGLHGAQEGDKVMARITEWTDGTQNLVGEVSDILGKSGENNAEMHAILSQYGLPYKFEEDVERAADTVTDDIAQELSKRRDFRNITTLTIDPVDAKDFDDALSLRELPKGNWEVGVHIADVTHYVRPNSILEEEALRRATSVYLVDRVVPMLPEKLSNGLCSLRPHEEKLCFSVVFEMDKKAHITSYRIEKTVINSNHRFSYEEVQEIIESKGKNKSDFSAEILTLHGLAQKLRTERFKNGAIAFERAESRFDIDKSGKPIGVYMREEKESHQLVEEFMLLANKSVAEHIGKIKEGEPLRTFVYRVHDKPNENKLFNLGYLARQLGYKTSFERGKDVSKNLNSLLEKVRGGKAQNIIETLALRCMSKASYTTHNIGHYGLAFPFYTHFTSPIRRYPDMMVHRLLAHYLAGGKSASEADYEQKCKHSSAMEQLAADAERASIKFKMVEYMQDKVDKEFDGVISGVTEHGIYVEINENKIEGMAPLRTFKNDYFYFDEDNYRIVGRSTKKTYTLGDAVRIKVLRVDMEKRQLDYAVVG
ncbi:ribonuclease R [Bacteroidia bacterium]|nr:ribonuclease R [Bacteroidia bacterium]